MKADPVIVICALVIKAKQCVRARARAFVVAEKFIPKSSIKADPVIVIWDLVIKPKPCVRARALLLGRSGVCFSQSKRSRGKAVATERERQRVGRVFHDVRHGAPWPVATVCDLASPIRFSLLLARRCTSRLQEGSWFHSMRSAVYFCASYYYFSGFFLSFSFLISFYIFFVDWWRSVVFEVSAGPGTWTWPFRAMVWGFDKNMLDLWLLGFVSYAFSSGLVISVLDILAIRNHAFFLRSQITNEILLADGAWPSLLVIEAQSRPKIFLKSYSHWQIL